MVVVVVVANREEISIEIKKSRQNLRAGMKNNIITSPKFKSNQ